MGCTSSAPNMVNSSTAEKSIQFEEDMSDDQSKDTDEIIYRAGNDTNEKTVLPSCDTLAEHKHVLRNRSTPSLKTEKDNQEDIHISEIINKTSSRVQPLYEEELKPKLEEVVEKAVQLYTSENINEAKPVFKVAEESETSHGSIDNKVKKKNDIEENKEHGVKQEKEKEDHPGEAVSPSQSESSRATRWEALADIAAELPPSLTVDPITGQIYTVTK